MITVEYYCRFKLNLDDVVELMATPAQIVIDKESILYPTVRNIFDDTTKHCNGNYMNHRIAQNHRAIKSHYDGMEG